MKKIFLLPPFFVFIILLPMAYVSPNVREAAIVRAVGLISYLCWAGLIGYYGQSMLKDEPQGRRNRLLFWLSFWLISVMVIIGLTTQTAFLSKWPDLATAIRPVLKLVFFAAWIWVPVYLGIMVVKLENKQREFWDYLIATLSLFPGLSIIGVWFIQPRLKEIFRR